MIEEERDSRPVEAMLADEIRRLRALVGGVQLILTMRMLAIAEQMAYPQRWVSF